MKKYLKQIKTVGETESGTVLIENFIAAPQTRCSLVNGRLHAADAVAILCAHGYKFHTTDDRLYHFTCPMENPVFFSLKNLRALAIGLVLTFQMTEEYQKEEKEYFQPSN